MENKLVNINENWVYQSNKLIEASYTLTVMEQKLVRLLASFIKKDDDDFKEYIFETKDLIEVLNTSSSRFYRDIDNLTDMLMARIIKVKDNSNKDFNKYHFVEVAKYNKGILKLKINPEMKVFYLGLDWYSKYQLRNIMQFKSTYSFRIYELLKQYEKIGTRTLTINDLRNILDIGKDQYTKYANLKQKVLNVAKREINQKTDIRFEFEEIKTGRKVTSIRFYIHSVKKFEESPASEEISITSTEKEKRESDLKEIVEMMAEKHIEPLEALKIYKSSDYNMETIKKVYKYFKDKDADNFVGLMIKMVKPGEFNEPKKNTGSSKLKFNNYKQREYDYDELEKKLLGWDDN